MLLGILADLHANLEATRAVLGALDAIGPDGLICLGDIAGYNANPNRVIDLVREREIPTVMGNHDAAACGLEEPWFFNAKAQEAIAWHTEQIREDNVSWLASLPARSTFSRVCMGVHGSPANRDAYIVDWLDAMRNFEYLDGASVSICFFGHTHRASLFGEKGTILSGRRSTRYLLDPQNRYLINPGSVGQPRDRDPRAAFGLFDTDSYVFEFRRVEYDVHAAAQKVLKAGLPEELARRLITGR
jgi:diadenosine tetraphosphatase ApaH/serine/threonine PP2A family protein phosphatase